MVVGVPCRYLNDNTTLKNNGDEEEKKKIGKVKL